VDKDWKLITGFAVFGLVCPQIIGAFNRLINDSNDSEQDDEACQSSKKISDPAQDASSSRSTLSTSQPSGLKRHAFLPIRY
jgi:hypothetical protein